MSSSSRVHRIVMIAVLAGAFSACGGKGDGAANDNAGAASYASSDCAKVSALEGYDIVLLIGQSNMTGYGAYPVPAFDTPDARIKQWSRSSLIIEAKDPLEHADYPLNTNRVGLALNFGKALLTTRGLNRKVLFVPAAYGGTGFYDGLWNPGGKLFEDAVQRANAAIATEPVGNCLAAILWHQGEDDVQSPMTTVEYQDRLDAMITALRSKITGARAVDVPFIVGGFSPEWTSPIPSRKGEFQAISAALPSRQAWTAYVSSDNLRSNLTQGLLSGSVHFDAASQRELGKRYFLALPAAIANKPVGR
jgi:Carbohydrate esterase, sialic acid-specific acetylesterase